MKPAGGPARPLVTRRRNPYAVELRRMGHKVRPLKTRYSRKDGKRELATFAADGH